LLQQRDLTVYEVVRKGCEYVGSELLAGSLIKSGNYRINCDHGPLGSTQTGTLNLAFGVI